jgi:hypothetical protein
MSRLHESIVTEGDLPLLPHNTTNSQKTIADLIVYCSKGQTHRDMKHRIQRTQKKTAKALCKV